MTDLTEFLLARIAEDEDDARAAVDDSPVWIHRAGGYLFQASSGGTMTTSFQHLDRRPQAGDHIARWNPARVLAECEAKRQIVKIADDLLDPATGYYYAPEDGWALLTSLAVPYADHPDYEEGWRP